MTPKKDYTTEALRLSKAIDIAIDAVKKYNPKDFSEDNVTHFVTVYSKWKDSILTPDTKFKNITSLKYKTRDVFTYFQEGVGKAVDHFWEQIKAENLGYVREDILKKILDRGKIRGQIEYEYAVDIIVVARQEGRTTDEESLKLSKMIGEFEQRKKK